MELERNEGARGEQEGTAQGSKPSRFILMLNAGIIVLLLLVGYFSYAMITRGAESAGKAAVTPPKIIQLDVLNGSGARGIAAKVTNYLRSGGFDVVEMKNYKTTNVPHTLVIDRVGNLTAARRVAASLGVAETNVIQQINQDYFVDVSVIIGTDYAALRSSN